MKHIPKFESNYLNNMFVNEYKLRVLIPYLKMISYYRLQLEFYHNIIMNHRCDEILFI